MAIPRMTREELKARLDAGQPPVIIDARLKYPYEHSTVILPGAVRVSPDEAGPLATLSGVRDVVVYDSDPDELVSAPLVASLRSRGITAFALKGGIAEWMAASLPTEHKDAPVQAPPQTLAPKG